jgi:hypothetical protein
MALQAMHAQLSHDQNRAADEWRLAPTDEALCGAHHAAAASARDAQIALQRLAEADTRSREAEQALQTLRQRLSADATDLRLPASPVDLPAIETALNYYHDGQLRLAQAAHETSLGAARPAAATRSRERGAG